MALRDPWNPDQQAVLIVPAGRGARKQAWYCRAYHCQNRRPLRPCRWIAFYSDREIDTLAEVDGPPEDDVVMTTRPEYAELAALTRSNGNPDEPHTLIRLHKPEKIGPVKNARGESFQNYRYTTLQALRSARFTHEL